MVIISKSISPLWQLALSISNTLNKIPPCSCSHLHCLRQWSFHICFGFFQWQDTCIFLYVPIPFLLSRYLHVTTSFNTNFSKVSSPSQEIRNLYYYYYMRNCIVDFEDSLHQNDSDPFSCSSTSPFFLGVWEGILLEGIINLKTSFILFTTSWKQVLLNSMSLFSK